MREQQFYQLLLGLSGVHKEYCTRRFSALGLTSGQPKVLSILSKHEGLTQKELALQCHVEPATMTVLLRNMEAAGLIVKERVVLDGGRWAFAVYPSDKGRVLADKVQQITEDAERACFSTFSAAEQSRLLLELQQVRDNLITTLHQEVNT